MIATAASVQLQLGQIAVQPGQPPLHCHTVADIEAYLRVTQELAQTFAN